MLYTYSTYHCSEGLTSRHHHCQSLFIKKQFKAYTKVNIVDTEQMSNKDEKWINNAKSKNVKLADL